MIWNLRSTRKYGLSFSSHFAILLRQPAHSFACCCCCFSLSATHSLLAFPVCLSACLLWPASLSACTQMHGRTSRRTRKAVPTARANTRSRAQTRSQTHAQMAGGENRIYVRSVQKTTHTHIHTRSMRKLLLVQ